MTRYLFRFLLMVLSYSYIAFSADIASKEPEYLMFIGNPGVGKSAIINSLIGKLVAQSGLSAGTGLTKFFSAYEHDGKRYFDTPGLADTKMREQAAKEIEGALKKDGKYRLFFVITLEGLRVKPADVTTINTVMAAIKSEDKRFNVIINKLTKPEKKALSTNAEQMASVYGQINSGEHRTESIWYIDRDRDLEDGDREFICMDANLNDFIFNKSLAISIAKENVGKIETDEFEKIRAQFEENLSVLREEIAAGNEKHKALIDQMKNIKSSLDATKKAMEDAQAKAQKETDKAVAAQKLLGEKEAEAAVARKEAEMEREMRRKAEEKKGNCTLL